MIRLIDLLSEQGKKGIILFNYYRNCIWLRFKFDIKDLAMDLILGGLSKNMKIWNITTLPIWLVLTGIETLLKLHSNNVKVALEIALDHLYGLDKNYYYKLTKRAKL